MLVPRDMRVGRGRPKLRRKEKRRWKKRQKVLWEAMGSAGIVTALDMSR